MFRFVFVVVLLLSIAESKPTATSKKNIEDFHLNLYKSIVDTTPNDNVFFSPFSISLALSMVAAGARGKTEKELLNLLQSPSRDKLDASVKQLMNITHLSEINLANRLYPDEKFSILPAFKQRLQKLYNISLLSVNLNAKNVTSVIDDINAWVSNRTNGHIKEALKKTDLDTNKSSSVNALLIINCLLFDAKWQSEFQGIGTSDGNTFYPDVGSAQEKKLTLMGQENRFPYVDLTSKIGAQMVHLPFQNKDLTFTIILPNKNVTLSQVESKLTSALLNSPTTSNQTVFLRMPKWKFEFESRIENVLKSKMKVNDIFDENKANLKGLSTQKRIYLSNFIHKTYVIVDEKGVKAAATSIVRIMLATSSGPRKIINFFCDKPFLYAIRYKQTTLFLGRYVKVIDTNNLPPIIDGGHG